MLSLLCCVQKLPCSLEIADAHGWRRRLPSGRGATASQLREAQFHQTRAVYTYMCDQGWSPDAHREQRRVISAAARAASLAAETPIDAAQRRETQRLVMARRRAAATSDAICVRNAAERLASEQRRLSETPEQHRARNEAARLASQQRRLSETPEQHVARNEADRLAKEQRRATESSEDYVARCAADLLAHDRRRDSETPAEHALRLERARVRARAACASQTPEERAAWNAQRQAACAQLSEEAAATGSDGTRPVFTLEELEALDACTDEQPFALPPSPPRQREITTKLMQCMREPARACVICDHVFYPCDEFPDGSYAPVVLDPSVPLRGVIWKSMLKFLRPPLGDELVAAAASVSGVGSASGQPGGDPDEPAPNPVLRAYPELAPGDSDDDDDEDIFFSSSSLLLLFFLSCLFALIICAFLLSFFFFF